LLDVVDPDKKKPEDGDEREDVWHDEDDNDGMAC